ncbi:MAG: hypothetical protein AB8G22_02255 [Saprospiraceae bacterium]
MSNHIIILFLALFLLTLTACESTTEKQTSQTTAASDLKTKLVGTWESVSLDVVINTIDGKDSTDRFTVEETNWIRKLGVQPVKTKFYEDGNKYVREFRDLKGELTNTLRGRWNVFGDTLMLIESEATYQYLTNFADGKLQLRATLDWDGDGAEDDDYLAIERKVSNYAQ